MKPNRLEKPKTAAKRVLSTIATSIVGVFVATLVAGFSGLFAPFWAGPAGVRVEDPFGYALSGFQMAVADAVRLGWPLGVLMSPLLLIPFIDRSWWLKLSLWMVSGAIYGQFAFGGYVRHGDAAGLIMAPYGLYCGLLAEPIHKGLWRGLSALRNGLTRLHQEEVG